MTSRKLAILISLIILTAAATAVLLFWKKPVSLRQQAASAASAGGGWLLQYQKPFEDPGIVWAINEINEQYCHLPQISDLVRERFAKFLTDPIQRAYQRLLDKTVTYQINYQILQTHTASFDDILIPALYCDRAAVPTTTLANILGFAGTSGYELAHRFLALQFLQNGQCFPEQNLTANQTQAAKLLSQEEAADSFGDPFAERIALLQYAGFDAMVQAGWIKTTIRHQSADSGAWSDPARFGSTENPHTTALAVWALSNYAKVCPFPPANGTSK